MKKSWKILAVIFIVVIMVFIVDAIYCRTAKVEPDDLYLTKENSEENVQATKGSYVWEEKGIIRNISVAADSIGPTSIDYNKKIEVKSGDKVYFNDCNWTSVGASLILQKDGKEIASLPIESNLEEKYIVIPQLVTDDYIIKIDLKSEKGEVWYSAKIKITE